MTQKLWQKKDTALHPAVNRYMISKNLEADNALLPYDVQASAAHARMLARVGLLTEAEAGQIVEALEAIRLAHAEGRFVLHQENEDVHTEIEKALVEALGPLGKRLHVGRSRNDQVLVAMRLYMKDALRVTGSLLERLATRLLDFAEAHMQVPMPGFTHMQHAMPSSVGQWAGAFVESLLADRQMLESAAAVIDRNPLGSAAGFGTGMPLDREFTTELLGFAQTQINPMFCQNSRGKFEAYVLHCLLQVMLTLGKLGNDMVIFCSQEFNFFTVDASMTTGSSIMPQKRNLDIMEVLRANVSVVQSLQLQVQTVGQNLISGYNKDLKITKKPTMDAFAIVQDSLAIVDLLFQHVQPNEDVLLRAFDDVEIFAADIANAMVQEGKTFRDAYREVGENLTSLPKQDARENIAAKTHLGATGNLGLERYRNMLKK